MDSIHGDRVQSVVSTADATLKATSGYVFWITISNQHATVPVEVEIADGGTDRWAAEVGDTVLTGQPFHANFDPPIFCSTSIVLDVSGGTPTAKITVGLV